MRAVDSQKVLRMACDEILEERDGDIMAYYQHGKIAGPAHEVICTRKSTTAAVTALTTAAYCIEAEKKVEKLRAAADRAKAGIPEPPPPPKKKKKKGAGDGGRTDL